MRMPSHSPEVPHCDDGQDGGARASFATRLNTPKIPAALHVHACAAQHATTRTLMDTVTPILLQAAAVIGNAALGEAGKRAVGDAWNATLAVIKRRFASDESAPELVNSLRAAAGDEAQTATIEQQLIPLQLGRDPEILEAIQQLASVMREQSQATNTVNAKEIKGAGMVFGNQHNQF